MLLFCFSEKLGLILAFSKQINLGAGRLPERLRKGIPLLEMLLLEVVEFGAGKRCRRASQLISALRASLNEEG